MVAGIKSGSPRGEGSQGPGGGVVATPQRNAPGRSVSLKAGGGASRDATWEGLKQRSLLKQPTENKACLLSLTGPEGHRGSQLSFLRHLKHLETCH